MGGELLLHVGFQSLSSLSAPEWPPRSKYRVGHGSGHGVIWLESVVVESIHWPDLTNSCPLTWQYLIVVLTGNRCERPHRY
jgi:hypothetical protein